MIIKQFFVKDIAHNSYILGGQESCAIIDPQRDVDVYIEATKPMGLKITHILETHLHADFISGHIDLSEKTGATIYAPESANCEFDHVGLSEGDVFEIDSMLIRVLETPGHTPEHISYVVSSGSRGKEPMAVFCGDSLFIGDVARPDLFPEKARELTSKLYDSIHDKLLKLPDLCQVYPAHGTGSLCGRAINAIASSTIGHEKEYNYALKIKDREEFIESFTANLPDVPDHFSRCSEINRIGPDKVDMLPTLKPMDPKSFQDAAKSEDTVVLDVRSHESFGVQHVPDAYSIDMRGNFGTFSGWLLPADKNILLVTDSKEQANEATIWLRRVGLDNVVGYLEGGMFAWLSEELPTASVLQLSTENLCQMYKEKFEKVIIDVRSPCEYGKFYIRDAINIPVPDLRERYIELDPEEDTLLISSSGHRSSIGASILQQNGFKKVYNVVGGMVGLHEAGYGPVCPKCSLPWAGFTWFQRVYK